MRSNRASYHSTTSSRVPMLHSFSFESTLPPSRHFSRSSSSIPSPPSPPPPMSYASPPPSSSSSLSVPMQIFTSFLITVFAMTLIVQYVGVGDALRGAVESTSALSSTNLMATDATDPLASPMYQELLKQLPTVDDHRKERDEEESVKFEIAYSNRRIHSGDYVPVDEASSAPSIEVYGPGVFTYILIDIDAPDPSAPSHAPFLHYIVANLEEGEDDRSFVVVPYYPVSPPKGHHRYISLLFCQESGEIEDDEPSVDTSTVVTRMNFDVVDYAQEHNLELVHVSHFYSKPEKKKRRE